MTETLIDKVAEFVTDTQFEDLPHEVVDESKRILLDSVGCALAGVNSERGELGIRLARQIGGANECSVIGAGDKLSSFAASFANGELINALDYDPVLPPGHVSPFVIPPLLALGEQCGASGKDLILATALAHEISTRMGHALRGYRDITEENLKSGKMDMPPVMGYSCCIFGGAAGAGKILRFDQDKMAHALGLAGHIAPVQSLTKWMKTTPIATTKYLLAGWMCEAVLTAAITADIGYKGDKSILEGEYGFWRFVGSTGWNPNALLDKLGQSWSFPRNTVHKPYPCCRVFHGGLDCLTHLIEVNRLEPEEIERVRAYLEAYCEQPAWMNREIQTQVDAQFSVAYNFSVAAHRVRIGPEWQDIEVMRDPHILAFMEKVSFEPHPDFVRTLMEDPNSRLAKVEIEARGKVFVEERKYAKGTQSTDLTKMSNEELVNKFRHNATRILSRHKIENAVTRLLQLETTQNINEVLAEVTV